MTAYCFDGGDGTGDDFGVIDGDAGAIIACLCEGGDREEREVCDEGEGLHDGEEKNVVLQQTSAGRETARGSACQRTFVYSELETFMFVGIRIAPIGRNSIASNKATVPETRPLLRPPESDATSQWRV
jgi:hypothetical protein